MRTINNGENRKNRYFAILRFLAVAAFICTVLLSLIIIIEGALPGKASGAQSNFVMDTLQSAVGKGDDTDDGLLTSRILVMPDARYADEAAPLPVRFYPSETSDRELLYESSDESVATVNEYGTVFYHRYGNAIITATLKSNPKIKDYANVLCYGIKPENITDITAKNTSVSIGTASTISLTDQNGNGVSSLVFDIESDDESVISIHDDLIVGIKEGSANVLFRCEETGFSKTMTYNVLSNPNYIRPQSFSLKTDNIDVMAGDEVDIDKILTGIIPSGASSDFDLEVKTENELNILTRRAPHIFTANRFGKATVILTSYYNPDCKAEININVGEAIPSKLSIAGNPRAVIDTKLRLTAFGDIDYVYNVKWEVIKGSAAIDENGVFLSKRLGNVTIRVTSNADPSIYAEYTLRVSLFSSFKVFVRKFIGHFLLFTVLGFGLSACALLLMKKRKYLFPVISAIVGFLLAGLSEVLQLPIFTTGRVASWTDVFIDVLGVLCGTVFASLIVLIYILIKKRVDKSGYAIVKTVFMHTNFRSVFTKSGALAVTSQEIYNSESGTAASLNESDV